MPRSIVNPATSLTNPANTPVPKGKNTLGKDDFLKLLVGQLQYQDPLNPQKGTEFAAQLAQFSSLEQMQNMNDNMTNSLNTNYLLSSSINNALASNFVGKNVKANSNQFYWQGGSAERLGDNLSQNAVKVDVTIRDSNGVPIRTLRGGVNSGENIILWDGKDDRGQIVDEGAYTFDVTAKDGKSNVISASTFIFGNVNGVRYDQNGTVFLVDGVSVKLADILEVLSGG